MRGISIIVPIICAALTAGSSNLFAQQCGIAVPGTTVYCCGQAVILSNEWAPGFPGNSLQFWTKCPVANCSDIIVLAQRNTCSTGRSTLEKRRHLDEISKSMPLLVASCTSGLVPYLPLDAEILDNKGFLVRSPRLDLPGGGK